MRVDDAHAPDPSADGLRVAVVTSIFNAQITSGLKDGAVTFLEEAGAEEVLIVDAPGAFELPLIAQRLASNGYDAIVCLGAVVEGDTDHYEHVAHRASEGLMRVQLDTGVPVAFGILTVREEADAVARSGHGDSNKGRESAVAAVMAANVLRSLDDRS
jgi:6,7-dimethyl-8-ribityllumazine synthase